MKSPVIVCLDLEGVLVPEIWINVALKTASANYHYNPRDAGLRCIDETAPGNSG